MTPGISPTDLLSSRLSLGWKAEPVRTATPSHLDFDGMAVGRPDLIGPAVRSRPPQFCDREVQESENVVTGQHANEVAVLDDRRVRTLQRSMRRITIATGSAGA
jgi:hypothetical protein